MACSCIPVSRTPLDRFVPYVLLHVKGVPDDVAAHAVRESAIELCKRGQVLKRTVEVDTQRNVHDYCLRCDDDDCMNIVGICRVVLDGAFLPVLRDIPFSSQVGYYSQDLENIFVFPAPVRDRERGLQVTVYVAPGQDCCDLPDMLYNVYAETIADGAVYRLAMMAGAPWYNMQQAQMFIRKYQAGYSVASSSARKMGSLAPVRARSRRWV